MSSHALRARERGDAGYTLLEVAVVISIIAIAAAVVGPSLWRPGAEVQLRLSDGRWVTLARDGRSGVWDTVGAGTIDATEQGFEFIGDGWAVVRFDSRGRAVGDGVSVSGPEGAITLRPDTWAGVLHVSRR